MKTLVRPFVFIHLTLSPSTCQREKSACEQKLRAREEAAVQGGRYGAAGVSWRYNTEVDRLTGTFIFQFSSRLVEFDEYQHTIIIRDMCAECGADLQQIDVNESTKASVPMIHLVPDLKVSDKDAKELHKKNKA